MGRRLGSTRFTSDLTWLQLPDLATQIGALMNQHQSVWLPSPPFFRGERGVGGEGGLGKRVVADQLSLSLGERESSGPRINGKSKPNLYGNVYSDQAICVFHRRIRESPHLRCRRLSIVLVRLRFWQSLLQAGIQWMENPQLKASEQVIRESTDSDQHETLSRRPQGQPSCSSAPRLGFRIIRSEVTARLDSKVFGRSEDGCRSGPRNEQISSLPSSNL